VGIVLTVAVESPYAPRSPFSLEEHVLYARLAMADSLRRGEAPFLSHLLYTQCLEDTVPEERAKGTAAGIALSEKLDFAAVYYDLGISPGMAKAIGHYRLIGKRCELRRLFSPKLGAALRAGTITLIQVERLA
jgi:hypothetical protein